MAKTVNVLLISVLHFLLILFHSCNGKCTFKPGFNGMFVFGDSLTDNGNNNFLITPFKANYSPYGIDFSPNDLPTGRFTNKKNQADHIGDLFGLPFLPSVADSATKSANISSGVNFASAGSGILDATGSSSGVIIMSQQINNFLEVTLPNLEAQQGCKGKDLLPHYLFLFSTGSNDYLGNFFQGGRKNISFDFFAGNLTSTLMAVHIRRLYNVGARKFAFLDLGPLGCTPVARATMPNNTCNETMNYAAFLFNFELVMMINLFKPQMPRIQSVVINVFQMVLEFIQKPQSGGFKDVTSSCCEVSEESGRVLCKANGSVCSNRSDHLFFDGLHPTDTLYSLVAARAYKSNQVREVQPYNLRRLANLHT